MVPGLLWICLWILFYLLLGWVHAFCTFFPVSKPSSSKASRIKRKYLRKVRVSVQVEWLICIVLSVYMVTWCLSDPRECTSSSSPLRVMLLTLLLVQIISQIAGPVLTVTLFSVLVVYASLHGYKLILTNTIVPLLSVVVRTSSTASNWPFLISMFLGWPYPRLSVSFG